MALNLTRLLAQLSSEEIQKLLVTKEEIETLEARRAELAQELAGIEKRLATLAGQVAGTRRRRGRPAGKGRARTRAKKAAKKRGRRAAAKHGARRATKKAAKKVVKKAAKKTAKKTVKKAAKTPGRKVARRAAGQARVTLEDVVVGLIEQSGEPMSLKAIHAAITSGKLFKSPSRDFANVLRRTLSTSRRLKRVARGVYGI